MRRASAGVVLAGVLGATLLGAPAAAGPDTAAASAVSATPPTGRVGPAATAAAPVVPDADDVTRTGESVLLDRSDATIAPGLELTSFRRLEEQGWTRASVLTADLGTDGLSIDHQFSGAVAGSATVREMAEDSGARVAINGDFYDIGNTYAPLGGAVNREHGLLSSPLPGRENSVAIGTDGAVALAQVFLTGEVVLDGDAHDVDAVNSHQVGADGIGVFTQVWGTHPRGDSLGAAQVRAEASVVDGLVTAVGTDVGGGAIDDDTTVLVGREQGAQALLDLEVGDPVQVQYAPRADFGEVAASVGGGDMLVVDGEVQTGTDPALHPRTAVGVTEDGEELIMVALEGRMAGARGMSLPELGELMVDLGAHDALNLDGGGSTTMVATRPAVGGLDLVNRVSDGSERSNANGLGLFTEPGSGQLRGIRVGADDAGLGTAADPEADRRTRVFPGLTRAVTAHGHDEALEPVDVRPRWSGDAPEVATVDPAGVVTGVAEGRVEVQAAAGGVTGRLELTVLGELVQLLPSARVVSLSEDGATATVQVTGADAQGYRAPIEPGDLTVSGQDGVVEVVPGADGLRLRAVVDSGSTLLHLEAAGVRLQVPVTVGIEDASVADFADADSWRVATARATAEIEPTEGPDGVDGVRISYDFSTGGNTRAAYATPPSPIEVPGQPRTLTAWVRGDGNGTWIRMRVRTPGSAAPLTLDGGYTTFEGWQQLTFPVPAGTAYPLTFQDVYAVQTGSAAYVGETSFAGLTAQVAPDVEQPDQPRHHDPAILTDGSVQDRPLRVAVMSDAQFVAANPTSDVVQAARDTLAEVVAAEPDLLVINGDLVDEASPADFDLAREVLDEGLAGAELPWYYLPGNHEVQGGPIENFIEEFGPTRHTVDVAGTRVVMLDTSAGSLRGDGRGFDQVAELRASLDDAMADDAVTGVLVLGHHAPQDPLPTNNSRLSDRLEAELLESWLADFRADSGKPAGFVGAHAGVFDASSVDGVPYLINGNAGKTPNSTPAAGGFTGWTMVGIDPGAPVEQWLRAETRARVDTVAVHGPSLLPREGRGTIEAELTQDEGRTVPVAWPVSAQWSGQGVWFGPVDDAPRGTRAFVAVDPATGEVRALKGGRASVTVTVNGVSATHQLQVRGPAR